MALLGKLEVRAKIMLVTLSLKWVCILVDPTNESAFSFSYHEILLEKARIVPFSWVTSSHIFSSW
jgi:hypothetical protein